MNNIMAVGKFLDQPRLVGKFSQSVPTILAIGGGLEVSKHLKETQKNKRKDEFIKSTFTLAGTMGTALVATRGMKPRKIGKFLIKGFNGRSKKIGIETHFGIFPLKYFFSEGMENQVGEEVSTRELKKALQECVDAENKKKPLTDEQLVVEMNKRGYKVARRTIAKYRGQLGIPLARWRKEL